MKQICNKTVFAMAAAALLLLAGCTKEPHTEGFGEGSCLSLSIDGLQTASASAARQGASTRALGETEVRDLWILQFQMTEGSTVTGTLVKKTFISSATDLADLQRIKFVPKQGANMALYLVANTNSTYFNTAVIGSTTLGTIKNKSLSMTNTTGASFDAVPTMSGQSANLTFPISTAVPVTLTRVAAKIILTIKNSLEMGDPQLTITSTQLKNVPTKFVVAPANGFTGTNYVPSAATGNFTSYTAVEGNYTAAGGSRTYYVAPNVRGIGTATDDRLKTAATAASGQGIYCTYVEILGTAKATATSPPVDVRYRLYLGGNNTNDYNLYSNTSYRADIELTGITSADARLTIATDKFDLSQGGIEGDHEDDIAGWSPVGHFYFTDGDTSPTLVSGKTASGVVYYVDPIDPRKFKVFSLDQGSNLKWSASTSYVLGASGQSTTNGKGNVAAMKSYATTNSLIFSTAFPAAGFCEAKNTGGETGWYLPALDELKAFYDAYKANQTLLDAAITTGGGIALGSGIFWSSTEYSGSANSAWRVGFSDGATYGGAKVSNDFVRCVREITPPPPPPPAVGDFYFTDGSFSPTLVSGKTVSGIIYSVDSADPSKFKVFSLDQGSNLKWAAPTSYVLGASGQSLTDGKGNVAAMKSYATTNSLTFSTAFPAAAFCEAKNTGGETGWYLPAKEELSAFYSAYKANQTVLDAAITTGSGIAPGSDTFWSSTEASSNASCAWRFLFSLGAASDGDGKYDIYSVRCVREN